MIKKKKTFYEDDEKYIELFIKKNSFHNAKIIFL